MANHHHESKYLANLLNGIFSGRMFEEWNKYALQPISVKFLFFIKDFED
jgi:hypothetical protein